jgi:hypothetical protein
VRHNICSSEEEDVGFLPAVGTMMTRRARVEDLETSPALASGVQCGKKRKRSSSRLR